MKKFSKKLVSLITAAIVTSGFLGTSLPAHAAIAPTNTSLQQGLEKLGATSEPVGGKYATNPNGVGKEKTMTIDGAFSDWTEDMIIAQGLANDSPVKFKGDWENCVIDSYSLYSAWDSDNLYIAWQNVNTADVTNGQGGALSEGKLSDLPQVIAIDTGSGKNMTGLVSDGKGIWGMKVNYTTPVDNIFVMHANGTGKPAHFTSDGTGATNYLTNCADFATESIQFKSGPGCLPSKLMGINQIPETPEGVAMLYDNSVSATDLKSIAGKPHNSLEDTFFEMKIPFKALGITKEQFLANGVGIMQIGSRGESGMDCLPHDKSMLDNVFGSYAAEPSNSHEKDDLDIITVPLARAGKGGTITPVPSPTISSLTSDKLSPQDKNTTINFSTVASGGTGALTYQYKVGSSIVQAYSSNSSFAWTPSVAGDYIIEVSVKDANGKTTTKTMNYTVNIGNITNPIVISSFTTSKTSPQVAGTAILLNALATGGTGTLQYQYTVNNGSTTSTIKSYSSTTSATWTPQAGTYTLTLTVKDSNNSVKSQSKTFTITPVTTKLAITKATVSASSVYVGQPVTISTEGTGYGTLIYKISVYDGVTTKVVKEFSTSKIATWTPTKVGTYRIVIALKDSTGKVVFKTISCTVKAMEPLVINNLSTSLASPQKVGTTIKLSTSAASSTVGTTLQYKYWVNDLSGNWIALNSFGTSNYINWVPKTAGMYLIWVDVKDSQGHLASKLITYFVNN